MRFVWAAAMAALAASHAGTALAGDPPRRTIDKNIQRAAARIAAEKVGKLRGMIFEDATLDHLTTGGIDTETQKSPRKLEPNPGETKHRRLPPIVHNDRDLPGADPFATHAIFMTEDGRERVSMVFGADGAANPPRNALPRLD